MRAFFDTWLRACAILAATAFLVACPDRSPPPSSSPASAGGTTAAAASALTNRIWLRTSPDPPLGSMLIFLSDGTLIQDSCWETYRLSHWRAAAVDTLRWQEDAAEIRATVVNLTESDLTLQLEGPGGSSIASYVGATVPYVCPDLPR